MPGYLGSALVLENSVDNKADKPLRSTERDPGPNTMSAFKLHQKQTKPKMFMLSILWNFIGVIYFELLSKDQTINSHVFCQQLMNPSVGTERNRPELVNRS